MTKIKGAKEMDADDYLLEILQRLTKIEEHLRNLNSKVSLHDQNLLYDCPKRHENISNRIRATEIKIAVGAGLLIAAQAMLQVLL